eukprot:scaffold21269_cov60-Phaeocystis_antarctica.AAC.7
MYRPLGAGSRSSARLRPRGSLSTQPRVPRLRVHDGARVAKRGAEVHGGVEGHRREQRQPQQHVGARGGDVDDAAEHSLRGGQHEQRGQEGENLRGAQQRGRFEAQPALAAHLPADDEREARKRARAGDDASDAAGEAELAVVHHHQR